MTELELLSGESAKYHRVMNLLKATQMQHGLCQPRSRRACTACNAKEELDKMVSDYRGARIKPATPTRER